MKLSIITVVRNGEDHIEECIKSILSQKNVDLEYIVVDGGSKDGTTAIIEKYRGCIDRLIFDKDSGIYEALNIGIAASTGEAIGFLHSDDFYQHPHVLSTVCEKFLESGAEAVYGDLVYIGRNDPEKIVRVWRPGKFEFKKMRAGWSLPHPTFFVRKEIYEKYGSYNEHLKISADYEMNIRLLFRNNVKVEYIPEVLVRMRMGGVSNKSISNLIKKTVEDHKAWEINGIFNPGTTILRKNIRKIPQFFQLEGVERFKNRSYEC